MNKFLIVSAIGLSVLAASSVSHAGAVEAYLDANRTSNSARDYACDENSFSNKVNDKINALIPQACEQLDTSVSLDGNPFAYENPNQSACDLGLPGLPSWDGIDFDITGANMCEVVKTVVGDQVKQLGGQMGQINDLINDNLSVSGGVDVNSAMESVIGN